MPADGSSSALLGGDCDDTNRNENLFDHSPSSSFARQLLQVGNDVRPLGRVVQPKGHVIARYYALGIDEPSIQRRFIPSDRCVLQRVRVGKLRVGSRGAAVYPAQGWPDFDLVERMAAGASFFEGFPAAIGVFGRSSDRYGYADNASKYR